MTGQYFESPAGPEIRRTITARLAGRDVELVTANGVFSAGGLDHATAVLLRELDAATGSRHVLDLGCGWGPIALALALAVESVSVDAVDVNERAVRLCALNADRLGLADRVRALAPDRVDPATSYDQIWSNPPVRIGKQPLHDLLLSWLPRLVVGGQARLVVGKNLGADPLQRWLTEQGYPCERVASAKGFRVLLARRVTPIAH